MLSTLCVRGTLKNTCEDSVFVKETESSVFGVVCDGCSTGINSSFASQLICYAFSLTNENWTFTKRIVTIADILYEATSLLGLNEMNLLSTCIMFQYNKDTKTLWIQVLGDGVFYVNNKEFIVEQNNTPDYMAYHLDKIYAYIEKYPLQVFKDVESFQICTDGVKSFSLSQFESSSKNPNILLEEPTSENYLKRMFNVLTKNKWIINDDLSIVSYAV